MKTKVKICGIRRLESARAALDAGAHYMGFNFVKSSKRYINPIDAKKIILQIKGKVKTVGVFQNNSLDEVNKITGLLGLDYVQLHGEESNEYCQSVQTKVIKAVSFDDKFDQLVKLMKSYEVKYFLLDRIIQGQGEMLNLEKAKELSQIFPIFFAGGLNVDNVSDVIRVVKPYAVDVASGIESDRKEDIEKIINFINKVNKFSYDYVIPLKRGIQ